MSKLKIIFWCILIAALGIIVYQNEAFFMSKQVITFKLFSFEYDTPSIHIGVLCIICALSVFLLTYIPYLIFRIKANRTIKGIEKKITEGDTACSEVGVEKKESDSSNS